MKLLLQLLFHATLMLAFFPGGAQPAGLPPADSIVRSMYLVNDHFLQHAWKNNDRNWIRGTYYTGLMAFQAATGDSSLYRQAYDWASKHGWRTGTEWTYPANRLTCCQTYLELYLMDPVENKILKTKEFMDNRVRNTGSAREQGWDYVDALYVGTPAWVMMSEATGDPAYALYGSRMFRDVHAELYDSAEHLFYRDRRAISERSPGGRKVLWSRGNGWAFASIPRILGHLPVSDTNFNWYATLFREMAAALLACQGEDGFWRTNLADAESFPQPESSGTAFFAYGLAWGVNNGILDAGTCLPAIARAWEALSSAVDQEGRVGWGQQVARGPGKVSRADTHEYVAGAYLLAGSEVLRLVREGKYR